MFSRYEDWEDEALRRGYCIDFQGQHVIAHVDGFERGEFDQTYAGVGCGWFYHVLKERDDGR